MTTTQEMSTKLAGLKKPCPVHDTSLADERGEGCQECSGTDQVYVFPDIVRPQSCPQSGKAPHWHNGKHYPVRGGRPCNQGWRASEDLTAWLTATFAVWPDACIEMRHGRSVFLPACGQLYPRRYAREGEPLQALLKVLEEAMLASAESLISKEHELGG